MTMKQMKLLGDFIMECVEGEPSQSEGVGDPAIRIIKQLQAELAEAKRCYTLEREKNNAPGMKIDSQKSPSLRT